MYVCGRERVSVCKPYICKGVCCVCVASTCPRLGEATVMQSVVIWAPVEKQNKLSNMRTVSIPLESADAKKLKMTLNGRNLVLKDARAVYCCYLAVPVLLLAAGTQMV